MGSLARTGFIMIAVGFPVYLLWRGRLPLYLALTRPAGGTMTTASAVGTTGYSKA
jgi:hypothetical protein